MLDRCEFGKDDYSLNIVNLPHDEQEYNHDIAEEVHDEEVTPTAPEETNKKTLFD